MKVLCGLNLSVHLCVFVCLSDAVKMVLSQFGQFPKTRQTSQTPVLLDQRNAGRMSQTLSLRYLDTSDEIKKSQLILM